MKISNKELTDFLNAANKATYANKDATKSASLRPSSEDYHFDILPVRGPREHVEGASKYENEVEGALNRFPGEEKIHLEGKLIYRGWHHGGNIE